jgi:hypothetical protein
MAKARLGKKEEKYDHTLGLIEVALTIGYLQATSTCSVERLRSIPPGLSALHETPPKISKHMSNDLNHVIRGTPERTHPRSRNHSRLSFIKPSSTRRYKKNILHVFDQEDQPKWLVRDCYKARHDCAEKLTQW